MPDPPDFDALYRDEPDPFGVRTNWYERRKQGIVLASLSRERYTSAWDPACGTGDLSLALAARCSQVLATDASERATQLTLDRTAGTQVRVRRLPLPRQPTATALPFDLIVLSEVLYYLTKEARLATYSMIEDVAAPEAEAVAVHWRHHPHDAYLSGYDVTQELDQVISARGWTATTRHDDRDFVLTGWVRGGDDREAR